ncbi:MAG: pantoate--beta-alanine ligase, partial [Bacilli bacterium]
EIVAGPIVREEDGLAVSSRNAYLTASERAIAPRIAQTLRAIRDRVAQGERNAALLQSEAVRSLEAQEGIRVDYLSFVDPDTLQPVTALPPKRDTLCAVAAYVGGTRLIDNIDVRAPAGDGYTDAAPGRR